MFCNFDDVFKKELRKFAIPSPCEKCDESRYMVNNPYYHSSKCDNCTDYKQWQKEVHFTLDEVMNK